MRFTKISIDNFRGIKHCELSQLGLVNLFFGKNNSGKSSLLEAIALLSDPSNPTLPVLLNNLRNLLSFTEDDVKIDFYGANPKNQILIQSEGEDERNVTIEMMEISNVEVPLNQLGAFAGESAPKRYGYRISFEVAGQRHISQLLISDARNGKVETTSVYKETLLSDYIPSSNALQSEKDKLEMVFKSKEEKFVIEALQIIEPRIKDIQLSGSKLMVDVGLSSRLPINVLGDGVRKVLSLVLAIQSCKGGVLLIDELENGLHFSVMQKLWKVLIKTAIKAHTQLFISTHSKDMLLSLTKCVQVDFADDSIISAYKLLHKDNDTVIALRYGMEALAFAMEQEMEVR